MPGTVDDDDRDIPQCWLPGRVEYRPCPGWPRYRVGSDRSVWHNLTKPGKPPPWDKPNWQRLSAIARRRGETLSVELHEGEERGRRSVELLYRAAFEPGSLSAACTARICPRGSRSPAFIPAHARPPVPSMPAIAAAELVHQAELHGPAECQITMIINASEASSAGDPPPIIDDDDERDGTVRGSAHGRAVLTEEMVIEARRLKAEGWSYPALVRRFGVGKSTLFHAISGRTWSHIPMEAPPLPCRAVGTREGIKV